MNQYLSVPIFLILLLINFSHSKLEKFTGCFNYRKEMREISHPKQTQLQNFLRNEKVTDFIPGITEILMQDAKSKKLVWIVMDKSFVNYDMLGKRKLGILKIKGLKFHIKKEDIYISKSINFCTK